MQKMFVRGYLIYGLKLSLKPDIECKRRNKHFKFSEHIQLFYERTHAG